MFGELRDKQCFRRAEVVAGTIVWLHEQDLCPATLYADAKKKTTTSLG